MTIARLGGHNRIVVRLCLQLPAHFNQHPAAVMIRVQELEVFTVVDCAIPWQQKAWFSIDHPTILDSDERRSRKQRVHCLAEVQIEKLEMSVIIDRTQGRAFDLVE